MSAETMLTLANGRCIDLLKPRVVDIDFVAYAEHLAKEVRYNGATRGVWYSVAQHVCEGVDSILGQTGDRDVAAAFSLHDHAEAVLKDDTTPKKRAHALLAEQEFGVLAPKIIEAYDRLVERHDFAIHAAAGLPWPLPQPIAIAVKHWDLRMFVTEWRDFMPGVVHPDWDRYRNHEPLARKLLPWHWERAADELYARKKALLPNLKARGA